MEGYAMVGGRDVFGAAREQLEAEIAWLDGVEAGVLEHCELERIMQETGRELQRRLLHAHLELRTEREARLPEVVGADGAVRKWAESGRARTLASVFGEVSVERIAYRRRGEADLHPLDAALNLPEGKYSHGLREAVVRAAIAGSYERAQEQVARHHGVTVPKRQLGELIVDAAVDFEDFYNQPEDTDTDTDTEKLLVLQCDGKGVVMRPDSLRAPTAKAAAGAKNKLATRLSRGEKANRKRMAEVACVYDAVAAPREAADIVRFPGEPERTAQPAPAAANKWLTVSVEKDAKQVISEAFDQAVRRDPAGTRTWVALVDGNNHQITRIQAEAKARTIEITIVVDFVHVAEYVWKAAWCFFPEGDPAAEEWVGGMLRAILDGHAVRVAGVIQRKATYATLTGSKRDNAHESANYLLAKAPYLDYPTALASGWPIATGVIEGAVRHLIKDRMDITGARWGLDGAEAILRLRALHANGDLDAYWHYHLRREHNRVHAAKYHEHTAPT
jgi:hypothetical protein